MRLKLFTRWKELRAARHEPEARRSLSQGYWIMFMIFALIVGAASVGYGVWQFTRPLTASRSEAKLGTPKAPLVRAELQEVLRAMDARAALFEERQGSPGTLRDPARQ